MLASKDYQVITINTRESEAINSAAIGILISMSKALRRGRSLRMTGCSASLRTLRLDVLIDVEGRLD